MTDGHLKKQTVPDHSDRVAGCLVGLATGDALGAPLEFLPRDEVRQRYPRGLREMIPSGLWKKGEYTDDTQMALLIAESLLENGTWVASDIGRRFQTWAKSASDVGVQTSAVINMPDYIQDPEACSSRYYADHPNSSAGNGALMRCAPIAIFCLHSPDKLIEMTCAGARVTHYDPRTWSSCIILNAWITAAIRENVRDGRTAALSLLGDTERSVWDRLCRIELCTEQQISSSGYTVHTLEAAVWSFLTTESFEEAVVRAANLGDDADTVAAVCGALAGAYYGYSAIPPRWKTQLQDEARIRAIALALGREPDQTTRP